jgi:hypothetical protein
VTVISESISTIAGADATTPFVFTSGAIRTGLTGTTLITPNRFRYVPVAGVLTTGSLEPGPAVVWIGSRGGFVINIPSTGGPYLLTPLIEANLPSPPTEEIHHIVDGGGATRVQVMTAAAYAALVSITTPDNGSVFLIY